MDMCSERLRVKLDADVIERAHRLGRCNGRRARPIIVKLTSTKYKDSVLSAAHKLKDTSYSISEDFSPAVREARRHLLAFAKAQNSKFKLRFNRLFIGDSCYIFDAKTKSVTPSNR